MMNARPEDADAGLYLFFIGEQANLVPAFILKVVIHIGRNAQMAGNVKVIVRSLKVLDPAATRDSDGGVAKQGNVGRGISLQRRDEDERNVIGRECLASEEYCAGVALPVRTICASGYPKKPSHALLMTADPVEDRC